MQAHLDGLEELKGLMWESADPGLEEISETTSGLCSIFFLYVCMFVQHIENDTTPIPKKLGLL